MAVLVILVLVVLWAAVLLPPILRSRNSSGSHGVSDFMDHLRSLGSRHHHRGPAVGGPVLHGPVSGRPPVMRGRQPLAPPLAYRPMAGGMSPVQRRRRNVLMVLGGAAGLTFLMAMMAGSMMFWLLFLVALGAFGAYVYMLVQIKQRGIAGRGSAPTKRVFATPVDVEEDELAKVGDNVVLLRRNAG